MNCPNCNLSNIANNNKIINIWNTADTVLFCRDCGLYFLETMPNQVKIDEYYKNEYHHCSKIKHFVKNIFRKFRSSSQFEYIKDNIKNLDGKKILEVGACDGLLLSYFKNSSVKGLEYSPVYKETALKKYNIDLIDTDFFDLNEKFDLIIMSHVIEHLPDLNRAVEKLKSLLNQGGYLFIEVPNSPLPQERDEQYINDYLTTPHLYNFTSKSLKDVFVRHGFGAIFLDRIFYNLPDTYGPKKQEEIAELFLKGSGLNWKNALAVVLYLLKNIVSPKNSYKKVDATRSFIGLGDNLRIILEKR